MQALRYAVSLPFAALAWLLFVDMLVTEFAHGLVVDFVKAMRARRALGRSL